MVPLIMIEKQEWYSAKELAGIGGMPSTVQGVIKRAKKNDWVVRSKERVKGNEYHIDSLPIESQLDLLKPYHDAVARAGYDNLEIKTGALETKTASLGTKAEKPSAFTYDSQILWDNATGHSQKKRDEGLRRARLLGEVMSCKHGGESVLQAFKTVAARHEMSPSNLKNWYYGVNNAQGARHYEQNDWAAALIPMHHGSTSKPDACHARVWGFYCSHYLQRSRPSFKSAYRRAEAIAKENGWAIMGESAMRRKLQREVSLHTIVLMREGPVEANRLFVKQKRDKSCFAAGQAVTGDGMKFDKIWVDWGDEIINTTTIWVWADIRTNYMMSYRIAKTENTDLFRLATYDLLGLSLPEYMQIDNTRVAANKAMTGQLNHRYRFKKKETDPIGMLQLLGIDVHFTNPDHTVSNPGVKPIERSFGIGGLHSEVVTSPLLKGQGFSKKTAVSIDLLREIVAGEVNRFNERTKRNTPVCGGVMSFKQAFDESFSQSTVRKATQSQREILLLMPEMVHASRTNGEISLKASKGPNGKNRYWSMELAEHKGQDLQVFYDPENLGDDIVVYNKNQMRICKAQLIVDAGFNDTGSAREHAKFTQRNKKAVKKIAENTIRMDELERAALYESTLNNDDIEVPEVAVVAGNFKQTKKVVKGEIIDSETPEDMSLNFQNVIGTMRENWGKDEFDE